MPAKTATPHGRSDRWNALSGEQNDAAKSRWESHLNSYAYIFAPGCPQWERCGSQRFATFWGHASNTPPQNSKSGSGGGKRMRRLADRHHGTIIYLQHRETALIGAVWTETKSPIGAIETGSVGQNVL